MPISDFRCQECDESEKYLAEGKKVTLKLSLADGKPKYELEVS